ncbi:hypothetical protein ACH42_00925 [Endozoicomonas sp. (ex Bugula neritina AB1)]|nr:hypothetical protein ACH42_00925 [Endozoicomonas sp. (ex Bugula neritina AB1)]
MTFTKSQLAVAVMAVTTGLVHAGEQPTLMDQITVTATRTEKQLKDVAASVTVIDEETIENQLATDIGDLVRYEPGVSVASDGRAGSEGYNIRGMDQNRVKIIVDGVNQAQYFNDGYGYIQSQRNFINVDSLKAVEIVKGPSSTLYGSDAIGGIVAYQTKDPSDYLKEEGDDTAGSAKMGYSSANKGFTETLTLANRTGKLESMLLYTRRDHKETSSYGGADTTGGDRGEANPLDIGVNNVLGKLQYQINDAHRIGMTAEYYQAKGNIDLLSSSLSTPEKASTGRDESSRNRVGVFHEWSDKGPIFDQMFWTFDWQKTERNQNTYLPTSSSGERQKDYEYFEDSFQFNIQFDKEFHTSSMDHQLIYGLSASQTEIENQNKTTYLTAGLGKSAGEVVVENRTPHAKALNYGIFVQDDIQATDRLSISPGVRFDYHQYKPETNNSYTSGLEDTKNSKLTAHIGSLYHLNDTYSLFGQFSQGFKSPDLYSMYFSFENSNHGYKYIPNHDLKPEEGNAFEVGLRGESEIGSFEVTGFYNRYTNFIDESKVSSDSTFTYGVFQYQNINKAQIYGVEMRGYLRLDEVSSLPTGSRLQAAIAYADGENNDTKEKLQSVAPLTAVFGLGYDDQSGNWGKRQAKTI